MDIDIYTKMVAYSVACCEDRCNNLRNNLRKRVRKYVATTCAKTFSKIFAKTAASARQHRMSSTNVLMFNGMMNVIPYCACDI